MSDSILFEEAVEATYWLLTILGEKHWAAHFARHRDGHLDNFKSIYGGMGSFNDLVICKANGHVLSEDHYAVANDLLVALSSMSSVTSKTGSASFDKVASQCVADKPLTGWRCRECGYAQIARQSVAEFHAGRIIAQEFRDGSFFEPSVLEGAQRLWNNFSIAEAFSIYRDAISNAGISLQPNEEFWQLPCPRCGKSNRCEYRWELRSGDFIPGKGNLSYKTGGMRLFGLLRSDPTTK